MKLTHLKIKINNNKISLNQLEKKLKENFYSQTRLKLNFSKMFDSVIERSKHNIDYEFKKKLN